MTKFTKKNSVTENADTKKDRLKTRNALMKAGAKEFGDDKFIDADSMLGNIDLFIPTGIPPIDVLLSGKVGSGFATGRIAELLGEADVGKTTLGCCVMSCVQKLGGNAVVIDTEKTLTKKRLIDLDVDTDTLVVVEENILENICDMILRILEVVKQEPTVIFWDTIASSISKKDLGRKVGESAPIGEHAKALSSAFRKIVEPLARSKTALILCNQRKQGGIGQLFINSRKQDVALGGDALKFHPTQRIKLGFVNIKKEKMKKREKQSFVVTAEAIKNKVSPTRLQVRAVLNITGDVSRFDSGASSLITLQRWNICSKTGRVVYEGKDGKYTETKFVEHYNKSKKFRNEIHDLLNSSFADLNMREEKV